MNDATRRSALSEDWAAVWLGLLIFVLSLGVIFGQDLLGWSAAPKVWTSLADAIKPISSTYAWPPVLSLGATIAFVLIVMAIGARLLGAQVRRFMAASAALLGLAYVCWIAGHYAYIAATSDKLDQFGIDWSLSLTGEARYIIAQIGRASCRERVQIEQGGAAVEQR